MAALNAELLIIHNDSSAVLRFPRKLILQYSYKTLVRNYVSTSRVVGIHLNVVVYGMHSSDTKLETFTARKSLSKATIHIQSCTKPCYCELFVVFITFCVLGFM